MANESNDLTRRDFARAAVAAAVAPALAACATAAPGTGPASASPSASAPAPVAATPAASANPQEPTALARALMDAVRAQYGDRMTEAEMAKVQRSISGVLSTAERLRRFPLPIWAEPALVYRVPGGVQ